MRFRVYPLNFHFTALDPVYFPAGQAANLLRGSFGAALKKVSCAPACPGAGACPNRAVCAYARLFEPRAQEGSAELGPSGLRDWPRPFVLRTAHLDGQSMGAGSTFFVQVNLFDMRPGALPAIERAFAQLGREGFGTGPVERRGRAELIRVEGGDAPLTLSLDDQSAAEPVARVLVRFLTPTELKGGGERSEFAALAARLRDRVSTLRALYGEGPLEIDFREFGERAAQIRTVRCELQEVTAQRRSRRTGQTHSLGGFVGQAEYAGDLAEFVPYLRAGRYTGVGRQTVWGKGEIEVEVVS